MSRFGNLEFDHHEERNVAPGSFRRDESFHLAEAQSAFERGAFEQALRSYSKALEFNPKSGLSWAGQVRMLIELGEFEEARVWADKALGLLPEEPELLAAKAVALARLGDLAGAMSYSDAAVESRQNTPYIWLSRADVLLAHNEKRAEFCFQKAFDLAPANWFVLWLAARIYSFYQNFARALKSVQDALALDAGRAVLWSQLAQAQLALGLPRQAQQSASHAHDLDPSQDIRSLLQQAGETTFLDKVTGRWRQWFQK